MSAENSLPLLAMPSSANRLTKLGDAGSAATMVLAPKTLPKLAVGASVCEGEPKLKVSAPARLLAVSMDTLLAKGRPSLGQNAKPQATKEAVAAAHTKKLAAGAAQTGSAEEREEAMD
jgi:hypothetical protein